MFCVRPRESLRGGSSTTTGGGGWGKAESAKTELTESTERWEGRRAGGDLAATGAGEATVWRGCADDGGRGKDDSVNTELSDVPEGGGVASAGESYGVLCPPGDVACLGLGNALVRIDGRLAPRKGLVGAGRMGDGERLSEGGGASSRLSKAAGARGSCGRPGGQRLAIGDACGRCVETTGTDWECSWCEGGRGCCSFNGRTANTLSLLVRFCTGRSRTPYCGLECQSWGRDSSAFSEISSSSELPIDPGRDERVGLGERARGGRPLGCGSFRGGEFV